MAELTKCEVCGHDMASDAKTCPNCGHPAKPPVTAKISEAGNMAISGIGKAVRSNATHTIMHGIRNFAVFMLKWLGIAFVNGLIFQFINSFQEGYRFSKENYLGCSIASTLIFPFTFGLWSLRIIRTHYGEKARKRCGILFFVLMIFGSFGPSAYLGFTSEVATYYATRVVMLFLFLSMVLH